MKLTPRYICPKCHQLIHVTEATPELGPIEVFSFPKMPLHYAIIDGKGRFIEAHPTHSSMCEYSFISATKPKLTQEECDGESRAERDRYGRRVESGWAPSWT